MVTLSSKHLCVFILKSLTSLLMHYCTNDPFDLCRPIPTTTPQNEQMTKRPKMYPLTKKSNEFLQVDCGRDFDGLLQTYRSAKLIPNHNHKETQYSGQHPKQRAIDWHGHGLSWRIMQAHLTASATPIVVLLSWLTIWPDHFIRLLEVTTNNAISELPPSFFLYCSQKLFFWLCEICMSLCPESQIIVWNHSFYWQRTIFSSIFYCLLKKNKKTVWGWSNNLERSTGKMVCLWTCLTFIYFISCLLQISGIWIILMVSSTTMCACVQGNLRIVLWSKWPRKVMVPWTVHWPCAVQVWNKKRETLDSFFLHSLLFLFISGSFLGSFLKMKFQRKLCTKQQA